MLNTKKKKRTGHVSRLLEQTVGWILYEMSTYIVGVEELRGGRAYILY